MLTLHPVPSHPPTCLSQPRCPESSDEPLPCGGSERGICGGDGKCSCHEVELECFPLIHTQMRTPHPYSTPTPPQPSPISFPPSRSQGWTGPACERPACSGAVPCNSRGQCIVETAARNGVQVGVRASCEVNWIELCLSHLPFLPFLPFSTHYSLLTVFYGSFHLLRTPLPSTDY